MNRLFDESIVSILNLSVYQFSIYQPIQTTPSINSSTKQFLNLFKQPHHQFLNSSVYSNHLIISSSIPQLFKFPHQSIHQNSVTRSIFAIAVIPFSFSFISPSLYANSWFCIFNKSSNPFPVEL